MSEKDEKELLALQEAIRTIQDAVNRTGRNDPCICGSDKKFKKCCLVMNSTRKHYAPGNSINDNLSRKFKEAGL